MNLVGKIFIVAILLMSVVYMGFAMAVYAAHKNWRDTVERTADQARKEGKDIGLRVQLETERTRNQEVKEQLAKVDAELAAERAALRNQLSKLETERAELETQRSRMQKELDTLVNANREMSGNVDATQQNLTRLVGEVEELRGKIVSTQQSRDKVFEELVTKTASLHDAYEDLKIVKERLDQTSLTVARYRKSLMMRGINPEAPLDGATPAVNGEVTAVSEKSLVEVSIGSDDGLAVGHTLEISRGRTYLGRVEVIRVAADAAVAKVLKDYLQGQIQKGDKAATRLRTADTLTKRG